MAKSAKTNARVATIAPRAGLAVDLANAYADGAEGVNAAQVSLLAGLLAVLKGSAPITATTYDETLAKGVRTRLQERGLSEGSAKAQTSAIKVATVCATHGILPEDGESLRTYVQRVRPLGQKKGVLVMRNGGNASRGADRKGGKKAGAIKLNAATHMDAALALVCNGDKSFAANLSLCLNDATVREQLTNWCAKRAALLGDFGDDDADADAG